ncbi:Fic family protein [Puteibacter caeruleilacunae]|nr:Fic family protein [Puteibacter caeruleilacunae]
MKIEIPPKINWDSKIHEMLEVILSKKFEDELKNIDQRYLYWDDIKYRKNMPFDDSSKNWMLVKLNRKMNYKVISIGKYSFYYYLTPNIQKDLHEFDLKLIGGIYENPITDHEKAVYLRNSLFEEAIASSQIEGAATTTRVAIKLLKSGRKPRNESEQMIFNNLRVINFIKQEKNRHLDIPFILEIQKIMTANTSAEDCSGELRTGPIFVQDMVDGEVAHVPPEWEEVEGLLEEVCKFTNSDKDFFHPIIKASIIHFFMGYIHPFKDGNGRTARALFYWYLLKKGYSLMENISISRAILDSRIQYDKAFLKTENDDNDLTYFIIYSIKSLRVAFERLVRYCKNKKDERDQIDIMAYRLEKQGFNERQAAILGYLYFKKDKNVSLKSYSEKHKIVRQTARKDLSDLVKQGLLIENREGRNIIFRLHSNKVIEEILTR